MKTRLHVFPEGDFGIKILGPFGLYNMHRVADPDDPGRYAGHMATKMYRTDCHKEAVLKMLRLEEGWTAKGHMSTSERKVIQTTESES